MAEIPQRNIPIPEQLNLATYYLEDNIAAGRGNKVAIYYNDERHTFNDLVRLTNKVGNVLKDLGVEPENRVLLILQDCPEWAASWFATLKIGAVGTHAYTYLLPDDYEYFLNYTRAKVVVADQTTIGPIREAARRSKYPRHILVMGVPQAKLEKGECDFNSLVKAASDKLDLEPTHRDDIGFWSFSGGTTGKPKAVPHMNRDGMIAFHAVTERVGYTEKDIVLRVSKLFFHYARDMGMNWVFRVGGSVIMFPERTTAKLMFELVDKFKPTILMNVPTMMRAMLQTPPADRRDMSSLRITVGQRRGIVGPALQGIEGHFRCGRVESDRICREHHGFAERRSWKGCTDSLPSDN